MPTGTVNSGSLVITSEFGTVSMWDWEIRDYLRRRGVDTVAPTSLEELGDLLRALAVRETLPRARMLAYLDDRYDIWNGYPGFWGSFSLVGEGAAR